MTLPAGYFYKDGAYWATTDNTGPWGMDTTGTMYLLGQGGGGGGGGGGGIPVMWGPFTASSVVKGIAGDPGIGTAIYCQASAAGNITLRNSATIGGGVPIAPSVTAVTMAAGQMITFGPADMPNGIVLDLNSGTGTFYVFGE